MTTDTTELQYKNARGLPGLNECAAFEVITHEGQKSDRPLMRRRIEVYGRGTDSARLTALIAECARADLFAAVITKIAEEVPYRIALAAIDGLPDDMRNNAKQFLSIR